MLEWPQEKGEPSYELCYMYAIDTKNTKEDRRVGTIDELVYSEGVTHSLSRPIVLFTPLSVCCSSLHFNILLAFKRPEFLHRRNYRDNSNSP